ncbi:MAG: hypothetical protein K9N21_11315 [Deltaproteobacteria bacterium]|nr:hypothetical protein [Deltaproteobacteria bacterium]
MHEARKAVCVPLSRSVEIGFVPRDGWDKYALCRRQLTWFTPDCPYYGRVLVISASRIVTIDRGPDIIIRESKLRRPELPDRTGQLHLIDRETYHQARPEAWEDIAGEDPELQERWLKIMGLRGITYDELFLTHCANHANFIDPVYFIREENQTVPYSIAKTTHICSACLEFFNIIGSRFQKKLVVPCPGAVLFAGLAANRYYEVVQPG